MNCPSCGVALPADARFCIECGFELPRPASTGATMALPRVAAGAVACPACGAGSPEGADYCVRCGRRLADQVPATLPTPPAPPVLARPQLRQPRPTPQFAPVAPSRARWPRLKHLSSAVLIIGIGLILLLKIPFWPTILIVCGLSSFLSAAGRGRMGGGLRSAIWLFGLTFLFSVPRLFVPGMIALVGLSIILNLGRWRMRGP